MEEFRKIQHKPRKQGNREECTLNHIIGSQEITQTLKDKIFKVFCTIILNDFFWFTV
jgi:hypothetical protein